ncbi:MAG: oligopeptide/dipeptide ABC transporter ATP-binding protein, partial [Nitrospinota bacterium]
MTQNLISVHNLHTVFHTAQGDAKAVDGVSLQIPPKKILAIVGESGCGKSVTALSLMGLIGKPAGEITQGTIEFQGKDLLKLTEKEMRKIRGDRISMIFQEPMTSLNPVLTIGDQITEVTRLHKGLNKKEARDQAVEMLRLVKIADPEKRIDEYPHQLSGGMKQRVMIAIALSCEPDLLIADEPTTALDVTVQAEILSLLKELQRKKGTSILLITHDMGVVYEMSDVIAVMYGGRIVESAGREEFFKNDCHPYTTKLFDSLPSRKKRTGVLTTIPGRVPSATDYPMGVCRFNDRCPHCFDTCLNTDPAFHKLAEGHFVACHLENPPKIQFEKAGTKQDSQAAEKKKTEKLLEVNEMKVYYPIHKGIFQRVTGHVKAVDGLSLAISKGETLALVGESGCGKTTAGKGIVRLETLTSGNVFFDGDDIHALPQSMLRKKRKEVQIM